MGSATICLQLLQDFVHLRVPGKVYNSLNVKPQTLQFETWWASDLPNLSQEPQYGSFPKKGDPNIVEFMRTTK